MSSLSTSLKNSYQKWLHPYEEYLRVAKPGVQQQLEFEYGGPFTPSSANSPMRRSHQDTPSSLRDDSPAVRSSAPLAVSHKEPDELIEKGHPTHDPPRTMPSSGFTAVNTGGFTPVNLTQASFQAINLPNSSLKREVENGTATIRNPGDGLLPTAKDMPEYKNTNLAATHLTNGHGSNPLKRTISHDSVNGNSGTDSGMVVDCDDQNGRRSKRLKKGEYIHVTMYLGLLFVQISIMVSIFCPPKSNINFSLAPTVVGSHMSLLRPTTPRVLGERGNGKPGEVKSSSSLISTRFDSYHSSYAKPAERPRIASLF